MDYSDLLKAMMLCQSKRYFHSGDKRLTDKELIMKTIWFLRLLKPLME